MDNNYYVIEIETMADGTIPHAMSDAKSKNDALSQMHQTIASAVINKDVKSVYVEVKDTYGNVEESKLWKAE